MSDKLELIRNELPAIEKILALNARPGTDVATIAAQEFMYLEAIAVSKPDILQCTPQSIILAVRSVMQKNLSLDPSAGLVYVKTRNVNTGTYEKPNWIKVVEMMPTANGLISINRQLGRILDFTHPKVNKDMNGKVISVTMRLLLPSTPHPRWEEFEFDESDFNKWRLASHKENAKSFKAGGNKPQPDAATMNYANPNYTNFKGGVDPEFARTKCVRHSLKRLGTNQQENTAVKIYDVPKERVVDPEYDEPEFVHDTYVEAEEVNTIINNQTSSENEIPNSNDL